MDSGSPLRYVRNDGEVSGEPRLRHHPSLQSSPRFAQRFAYVLHSRLKIGRAVLVASLLALALGACGRKGPLEAPPNVTGAIDLPDSQIGAVERDAESLTQNSILAKPPKASRQIVIPEKPFVLDAIL